MKNSEAIRPLSSLLSVQFLDSDTKAKNLSAWSLGIDFPAITSKCFFLGT